MHKGIISRINREEIVKMLSDFVKTPSVSGKEAEFADKVANICENIGLDTKIDRHGNVIAILKGSKPGPRIALNSHLDTVDYGEGWTRDPLGAKIEGDLLYGRGSADCKASMVCHIVAVNALKESEVDLAGEVVIAYAVEEEVPNVDRKGTVKLIKDGFTADMAINGEATNMDIAVACEGMLEIKIITMGKSAHGSNPKEGINAINHMYEIIKELNKLQPGFNKYTGYGSIVPGVIKGGERSSVVPDNCELKVSRFIVFGENGAMFYSQVQNIIEKLKHDNKIYNARAELTYESRPMQINEDEQIVKYMIDAYNKLGRPYKIVGTPQHDDADYLVNMANIPTVIFGPGQTKVGHTPDEYVELSDVVEAAKIYALTLYNALKG